GFFDLPRRVAECLDRDEGTRRGDTQQLQAPAQALAPEVARDDDQIDIAPGMRHALRPRPEQGDALGADAKPPQLAAERAYFPAREGCFRSHFSTRWSAPSTRSPCDAGTGRQGGSGLPGNESARSRCCVHQFAAAFFTGPGLGPRWARCHGRPRPWPRSRPPRGRQRPHRAGYGADGPRAWALPPVAGGSPSPRTLMCRRRRRLFAGPQRHLARQRARCLVERPEQLDRRPVERPRRWRAELAQDRGGRRRRLDAEAQARKRPAEPLEVLGVPARERNRRERLMRGRCAVRARAELPQRAEHLVLTAPAQLEEEERVLVLVLTEHGVGCGELLGWVGQVRALVVVLVV